MLYLYSISTCPLCWLMIFYFVSPAVWCFLGILVSFWHKGSNLSFLCGFLRDGFVWSGGHTGLDYFLFSKLKISNYLLISQHNMEQNIPVRVTRGHESANSYCGKVYTYDGLYKVSFWLLHDFSFFGFTSCTVVGLIFRDTSIFIHLVYIRHAFSLLPLLFWFSYLWCHNNILCLYGLLYWFIFLEACYVLGSL